jgi:hypothetical protein
VATLPQTLARIKGELARLVPEALVRRLVADQPRTYRERTLTPVVTAYLALRQVLHGHVSAAGLRHVAGLAFTPSAYGQARGRLSVGFFADLLQAVTGRLRAGDPERPGDRWRGHRVWLMDGSSFSMPDTPELQEAFGQPSGQAPGCGFPVAHLLLLVEAAAGYVRRVLVAPLSTHDLARAAAVHPDLGPGDLLVGDRAFGSFAHLALLRQRGAHGLFRQHQRRPRGRARDRRVTYRKPPTRPVWLTEAAYAALPEAVTVREIRVRVTLPGRRVRLVDGSSVCEPGATGSTWRLHYALNLPTSVVITGIDSMKILDQALEAVRTFKPMSKTQVEALLSRTAQAALSGKYERFKTTPAFDATAQHPEWLG